MNTLFNIIIATSLLSLVSLVGVFVLFLREELLKKIIPSLVAFSAGALLGAAMLHMIPEAIKGIGMNINIFVWVLIGFSLFFLLEQFINWHHCHKLPSDHKQPVTYLLLIADALHNFLGGLAIGSAFLINTKLGIVTTLVSATHEIPQELGDFGILIHGGWTKFNALLFNFLSSLTVILGGVIAYFASGQINIYYLLPFAAGNFIYISSSDLIPEIKHGRVLKNNIIHFIVFLVGIYVVWLARS